MKKIIILSLTILTALQLCACSNSLTAENNQIQTILNNNEFQETIITGINN